MLAPMRSQLWRSYMIPDLTSALHHLPPARTFKSTKIHEVSEASQCGLYSPETLMGASDVLSCCTTERLAHTIEFTSDIVEGLICFSESAVDVAPHFLEYAWHLTELMGPVC